LSLRMRLILSFVLIIVLCLGIVGASLVILLGDQINKMAMAHLADTALPIYVQFRAAARGQITQNQAWTNLQETAEETGTYIFLLDVEGNVIKQAIPKGNSWTPPSNFEIVQPPINRPGPYRGITRLKAARNLYSLPSRLGHYSGRPVKLIRRVRTRCCWLYLAAGHWLFGLISPNHLSGRVWWPWRSP